MTGPEAIRAMRRRAAIERTVYHRMLRLAWQRCNELEDCPERSLEDLLTDCRADESEEEWSLEVMADLQIEETVHASSIHRLAQLRYLDARREGL